ncbi:complement receptor type 1-like isoform X2 [Ptychodera flava]|uniref:complement receptor type 1-like isoform X2 n=1 Tax=Ptychodera flava TaxID=63121 RepID=UPI003969C2EF
MRECEDPSQPDNGRQMGNYTYPSCHGTNVTFSCDYLYELVGSETITCTESGWSTSVPECVPQCLDLGNPEYGYQIRSHLYPVSNGTIVEYQCNPGYRLHDANSADCIDFASSTCRDGSWTHPLPLCVKECEDPGRPANGNSIRSQAFPVCSGTSVIYACQDGYELEGANNITCIRGEWNEEVPKCVGNCQDPGVPENGYQRRNYTFPAKNGTLIEYGCNDGWMLYDAEEQKCLKYAVTLCDEGTWSQQLPDCVAECSDPGNPRNGRQVGNTTYPVCTQNSVSFTCDYLFELVGSQTIVCLAGMWNDTAPVCVEQCIDPGSPTNGSQVGDHNYPVSYGTVVEFDCDPLYRLHDPSTGGCIWKASTSCLNGTWSEPLPSCWRGCLDPGQPTNGFQQYSRAYPVCSGTKVSFDCENDYDLHGSNTSVCSHGQWSDHVPACIGNCKDPGAPDNGYQKRRPTFPAENGTLVEFACDHGYNLFYEETSCVEAVTTTCVEGTWSHPTPQCMRECEDPSQPDNGRQMGNYTYPSCHGTNVTFSCDYLYELVGSETITCTESGWSTSVPECVPQCLDLGNPEYGYQIRSHLYPVSNGTIVEYQCNPGYRLHDANSADCIDFASSTCRDGSWTHPLPLCVKECEDPGRPANGNSIRSQAFPVCSGTSVMYACQDGYELEGANNITCIRGEWNEEVPKCIGNCQDPGMPENGYQRRNYTFPAKNGTLIEYGCNDGWLLYDAEEQKCLKYAVTLCDEGTWSQQLPDCVAECSDPGNPRNGRQVGNTTYPVCTQTLVSFTCDYLFELVGSQTIVCLAGMWNDTAPVCVEQCIDPGSPTNGSQVGDHNYPVSYGTVVEFDCDPLYRLHDPSTGGCIWKASTSCLNGTWSEPLPSCWRGCLDPGQPTNGFQQYSHAYPVCSGTKVSFDCENDYDLHGSNTSVCSHGQWSDHVPACIGNCKDPGAPDNGYQKRRPTFPAENGTLVEFACDHGYNLFYEETSCVEAVTTTCVEGTWSYPTPQCMRECEDPGRLVNGRQMGNYTYPSCHGTNVTFSCDYLYELVGSETITCTESGWSMLVPECVPQCLDQGNPEYGYQIRSHLYPVSNGTIVEYKCNPGYRLHDAHSVDCIDFASSTCRDGSWTHPRPLCVKECEDPGRPANGFQVNEYVYPVCDGVFVQFECNDGYLLTGAEILSCNEGLWSNSVPECELGCDNPGKPENGGSTLNHKLSVVSGTLVRFFCDEGFSLFDQLTLMCSTSISLVCHNTTWSSPIPLCKADCIDPGLPDNGYLLTDYNYPVCTGTVINYGCIRNYELVGSHSATCLDGNWSHDQPICKKLCTDPGYPANGGQLGHTMFPASSKTAVYFYCEEGYQLFDTVLEECVEIYMTVCQDGDWSNPIPTCILGCSDPGIPDNGYRNEILSYPVCVGTAVSFACGQDFSLVGKNILTCINGNWSQPLPSCYKGCQYPAIPRNGHIVNNVPQPINKGTVIRYCCNSGYAIYGENAIICHDNGKWSHNPPECIRKCDDPGAPANGYKVRTLRYPVKNNTSVIFSCDSGYYLYGPGMTVCEDGVWTPPVDESFCAELDECCSDPCQNGGTCINGNDRYDCICPSGFQGTHCDIEFSVCYFWGDPHYITYDGVKYEFQGACSYILTESSSSSMTSFRVIASNEDVKTNGDETFSVTGLVQIIVYGTDIKLLRENVVQVDGVQVSLPFALSTDIMIKYTGRYITVETDFGLSVRWDSFHQGDVKLPGMYKNSVRGLCGNYNDDPNDDFTDLENELIPIELDHSHRAALFGNIWVTSDGACDSHAGGCNPCATDIDLAQQAQDMCAFITNEKGPFSLCHSKVNPDHYVSSCMFDVCSKLPDTSGVCMNGEAYAQTCLDNGISVSWRRDDFCALSCADDRVYNNSVSPCDKTCRNKSPHLQCAEPRRVEGCTCPDSTFLNHENKCVPLAECGCTASDRYIQYKETFVKEHCDEECTCLIGGHLDCIAIRCDPNAYCGNEGGVRDCYCNGGFIGNGRLCVSIHCSSNPCMNNATCTDHETSYQCKCPLGFAGDICDEDINECLSNPCLNNGTCIDKVNGFVCICTDEWEGDNCDSGTCNNPGIPINGFQVDGLTYPVSSGTVVTLNCNTGYDLIGVNQIICLLGQWSDSIPECMARCQAPGVPVNGGFANTVSFPVSSGNSIEYECDEGYDVIGSLTITCDNGEWIGEPPGCVGSCDDPGHPEHGKQRTAERTQYPAPTGAVLIFECDVNFDLFGSLSVRCNEGVWVPELPRCLRRCDNPGSPGHGSQLQNLTYPVRTGANLTFACSAGYEMSGAATTSCYDGNWSEPNPTCKAKSCQVNGSTYDNGTKIADDDAHSCDDCICLYGKVRCTQYWEEAIPCDAISDQTSPLPSSSPWTSTVPQSSMAGFTTSHPPCTDGMTCQVELSECISDPNCKKTAFFCKGTGEDQQAVDKASPCYGHVTGTVRNCGVMRITYNPNEIQSSQTVRQLCQLLEDYLRGTLPNFPICSKLKCFIEESGIAMRRRKRANTLESRVDFEIKPNNERNMSAVDTADLMTTVGEALVTAKRDGTLPGDLSSIDDVTVVVDGGWGDWYPAGECSETCGGGRQLWRRNCDQPPQSNGGASCAGDEESLHICNEEECPARLTNVPIEAENQRSWIGPTTAAVVSTFLSIALLAVVFILLKQRRNKRKKDNLEGDSTDFDGARSWSWGGFSVGRPWFGGEMRSSTSGEPVRDEGLDFYESTMLKAEARGDIPSERFILPDDDDDKAVDISGSLRTLGLASGDPCDSISVASSEANSATYLADEPCD